MSKKVFYLILVGWLCASAPSFTQASDERGVLADDFFTEESITAWSANSLPPPEKLGVVLSKMPDAKGTPSYSGTFKYLDRNLDSSGKLTFWREVVDNKERLFVLVEPINGPFILGFQPFYFCPAGIQYSIVQNGTDYGKAFNVTDNKEPIFCGYLHDNTIFLVDQPPASYSPNFDEAKAFTVSFGALMVPLTGSGSVNVAASISPPVCSLTATPASVTSGGTSTLAVSCSPAASAYAWSSNTGFSSTATSGTVSPSTTTTYSVVGSNAYGSGNTSSATVTFSGASTAKPSCSLSAVPATIAAGGTSTLTASCTPTATSYLWTGGNCAGTSSTTCTVLPLATTTYTVQGSNAGGTGNTASAIVTVGAVSQTSYMGLWGNSQESGWGMSITQHDSKIFAAVYTYDSAGQPTWYVMSSCPILNAGSCTGELYKVTGGSSPLVPWNGTGKVVSSAGSGTLTFDDVDHGKFDYVLNGIAGSRLIERQLFSNGTPQFSLDYTDLWWNASESGWGVALTQDRGMIFAAWFSYDDTGNPVWYVASACPLAGIPTLGNGCTGDLYRVTGGSSLATAWNGANRVVSKVGSVTFTFSDASNGLMSYSLNKLGSTRAITRQGF